MVKSTFLNLDTDTTLGGSNASDYTIASQKAVKSYVDNHSVTTTSSVTSGSSAALTSGGAYTNLVRRLSTSAATGSASQGVYVDANGQVQTCTAVTSTYAATGTAPVNGTAVSNAIAVKQDTLVSGTNIKTINGSSLLGSGNITIETSSTPNVDGETVSYNSSDALQAIAVKNVRDGSTLPIWHGTEYQWNHGDPTTWYYWQTSVTALWTSGGSLPSSGAWGDAEYANGSFVVVKTSNSKETAYSTDGGVTWQSGGNLPSSLSWSNVKYGDGVFITIGSGVSARSTDGGVTWQSGGNLPVFYSSMVLSYSDGRFVGITYTGKSVYSTDGGLTWQSGGDTPFNAINFLSGGNGIFVASDSSYSTCSTDGGLTWNTKKELPIYLRSITFDNDKFIIISDRYWYYSTDGETWIKGGNLSSYYQWQIGVHNNIFIAAARDGNSSDKSIFSTDGGVTWNNTTLPYTAAWRIPVYGDGIFVSIGRGTDKTAIFTVQYDKCYTDTANPTTTSVVYSAPDSTSALTISSITSGAITLSNNNTYYYNQSGNVQTYDTIGNSHPEYLCFIDGVGVKIGNTTIATNTPITTTITSSSTDAQAPSAKAVYDALNP